jgi:hypothetical protein
MKQLIDRLWTGDPSQFIGRAAAALGGLIAILIYAAPFLDSVDARYKGIAAFLVAVAIPKLQAVLTALRAYKPSTVNLKLNQAFQDGVTAAEGVATEKAAAKKRAKKAARLQETEAALPVTETTPKAKSTRAPRKQPRKSADS